jgi:hypothetical protein
MSCPEPEQIAAAPPPPVSPPPPQDESNGGAAHAESDVERMESESDGDGEKKFDKSTGKKRNHTYGAFREYREVGRWPTGPDSLLDPAEIDHHIKMRMKKFMQDSRLMIAPGKDPEKNKTDIALWKQQRKPYWNSRTDEWVHMFMCPMHHRCKCKAMVRIITAKDHKRLEFVGTHDETSHANDISKSLTHKQIVTIHQAVMVAPKQSAASLRRNLMHVKGSPEQHKKMDPTKLRCIQRHVQTARKNLTMQKLATATVPESIGDLAGWCEQQDFWAALRKHNDPADKYFLPLHGVFVLGSDIKAERQAIYFSLSSPWFLANCIRALECGWVMQLNGDGTFGFCRHAVDMLGLGFCSMGGANHPAVWSFIPHQGEGELTYTVTFRDMEKAALALLTANVDKECDFTRYLKHLLAQPNVQKFLQTEFYKNGELPIDQAQCDHQAGWHIFSVNEFWRTAQHMLSASHR